MKHDGDMPHALVTAGALADVRDALGDDDATDALGLRAPYDTKVTSDRARRGGGEGGRRGGVRRSARGARRG